MPRQKKAPTVVNEVKPHTVKKFELVEKYVDEWARKILGVKNSKGIVFIDCMCNSGLYITPEGEPIYGTPIRVAQVLNNIIENYPDKTALLFYNDLDQAKIDALKSEIENHQLKNVNISYSVGDGNAFLTRFQIHKYPNHNKLLFYDPYKASIDWSAITPFLHCWGEVIINHMVYDTVRGVPQVNKSEKVRGYELTYQKEIDDLVELVNNKTALEEIIIDIIRKRSDGVRNNTYIASFPFYTRTNGLIYNLIHYSQSIHGFKLFKKIAWQCFGGRSSMKKEKVGISQVDGQISWLLPEPETLPEFEDDKNYGVIDIAEYIHVKYKHMGEVNLEDVYSDLDHHPIFPADGYRNEIKSCLKEHYNATCTKTAIRFDGR